MATQNRVVQRINELDNQIAALKKHKTDGDAHAAGITLILGIGANGGRAVSMEFGATANISSIFDCLLANLEMTRAYYIKAAKAEHKELTTVLNEEFT